MCHISLTFFLQGNKPCWSGSGCAEIPRVLSCLADVCSCWQQGRGAWVKLLRVGHSCWESWPEEQFQWFGVRMGGWIQWVHTAVPSARDQLLHSAVVNRAVLGWGASVCSLHTEKDWDHAEDQDRATKDLHELEVLLSTCAGAMTAMTRTQGGKPLMGLAFLPGRAVTVSCDVSARSHN